MKMKRIISFILALNLMLSCAPVSAFATNQQTLNPKTDVVEEVTSLDEPQTPSEDVEDNQDDGLVDQEEPEDTDEESSKVDSGPAGREDVSFGGVTEVPQQEVKSESDLISSDAVYGVAAVAEGTEAMGLGGGSGTERDPYLINTYSDLLQFAANINNGESYKDQYVALGSDIVANDTSDFSKWSSSNKPENIFKSIDGFEGHFDGKHHTIEGLYIYTWNSNDLGFFGEIESDTPVTIKNVNFKNCYVSGGASNDSLGGIVGSAEVLKMEGCIFMGVVQGSDSTNCIGGLIGKLEYSTENTIKNCTNFADIYGGDFKTGLNILNGACTVGGIGGTIEIERNLETKEVQIEGCKNYGNIYSSANYTGGLFGQLSYRDRKSNNAVSLALKMLNVGDITSTGTGENAYTGGVIGNLSLVTNSYANVTQCANYGDVTGGGVTAGVIGKSALNNQNIYYSGLYNVGDVCSTGSDYAAGVVGEVSTSNTSMVYLEDSFNKGSVSGNSSYGGYGILAKKKGNKDASLNGGLYILTGSAKNSSSGKGMSVNYLEASDFKKAEKFPAFDFDNVWKMNTNHPVFQWETSDFVTTISNNDIIKRVGEYTSTKLYDAYERIMNGDYYSSPEQKNQALQKLFEDHGISDVYEGIQYLSSTNDKHKDYLALTTNENFISSIYTNWLTKTLKGTAFRALVLTPASLAYNNEINDWLSFPTYAESEYPGVKKYKAMFYDLLDTASIEIEVQTYIKTLSDIASNSTDNVKDQIEDLIDTLNTTTSGQEAYDILFKNKLWEELGRHSSSEIIKINDAGEEVFTYQFRENSGFGKFAKRMNIAGTFINVADTSLSYFLDMNMLDARLKAYVEFEDFLYEVARNTRLPFQMRWAAAQIVDEMETGYAANVLDFVIEIFGAGNLNNEVFDRILDEFDLPTTSIRGYLATINITSFFVNCLTNLGETMQNVAFVEGYSTLADWYSIKVKNAAIKFNDNSCEDNAWDFVYAYNMLWLLREKGEEAYVDLLDIDGIADSLVEQHYNDYRDVAKRSLKNIQDEFKFDLTGITEVDESVQYLAKMIVSCPVDVTVYAPDGSVVATLKDGVESDVTNAHGRFVVQYDLFTGEYEKIICISQQGDYSFTISAVDKGLVNLTVAMKDGSNTDTYEFNHVKVEEGTIISTSLTQLSEDLRYDVDEDGDGTPDAKGSIEKNPAEEQYASDVAIDPATLTLCLGESTVLGLNFEPIDTTNKAVFWFVSDESVVSMEYGKLTALKEGTATVTAYYGTDANGEEISGSCEVTVQKHNMVDGSCTNCGSGCDNHEEVVDKAVAPTCSESGLSEGKHCGICGKVLVEQEKVPELGHTDENNDFICDICSEKLCTEHKEEVIPAVAPTCTKTGLTEGKHCSTCGEVLIAQTVVEKKGHTYVKGACTDCGKADPQTKPEVDTDKSDYYTIKVVAGSNGSISPNGTLEIREGKNKTFHITADSGYVIDSLTVDRKEIKDAIGKEDYCLALNNVDEDYSIRVDFVRVVNTEKVNPQTGAQAPVVGLSVMMILTSAACMLSKKD